MGPIPVPLNTIGCLVDFPEISQYATLLFSFGPFGWNWTVISCVPCGMIAPLTGLTENSASEKVNLSPASFFPRAMYLRLVPNRVLPSRRSSSSDSLSPLLASSRRSSACCASASSYSSSIRCCSSSSRVPCCLKQKLVSKSLLLMTLNVFCDMRLMNVGRTFTSSMENDTSTSSPTALSWQYTSSPPSKEILSSPKHSPTKGGVAVTVHVRVSPSPRCPCRGCTAKCSVTWAWNTAGAVPTLRMRKVFFTSRLAQTGGKAMASGKSRAGARPSALRGTMNFSRSVATMMS